MTTPTKTAKPAPPVERRMMTAQKLPPSLVADVRELLEAEGDTWTAVVERSLRDYVASTRRRQARALKRAEVDATGGA